MLQLLKRNLWGDTTTMPPLDKKYTPDGWADKMQTPNTH